jgi:uncharacterized protein (DUF3084 family)
MKGVNWPIIITSLVAFLGASGGLWSAMTIGTSRRKLAAETASIHTSAALELVAAIRADAEAARREAVETRKEAIEARREAVETRREAVEARTYLGKIREEAEELSGALAKLVGLIHEPKMTMERLREATRPPTPPVDDA